MSTKRNGVFNSMSRIAVEVPELSQFMFHRIRSILASSSNNFCTTNYIDDHRRPINMRFMHKFLCVTLPDCEFLVLRTYYYYIAAHQHDCFLPFCVCFSW